MTGADDRFHEFYFKAQDGLRLYVRHYPAALASKLRRPVLCLSGLTRNSRDFHDIATALASDATRSRDVYTLDYRGRGRSEYDPDWRNYTVPEEMQDALDLMTVLGLRNPTVFGTSRGGLIAMLMGTFRPRAFGAVVLNDIGPVIDRAGLNRITAYVGRIPIPSSWPEAGRLVRDICRRPFPAIPDEDWEIIARQWFNEHRGRPAPGYDPKLANAISVLDGPMPDLWPQFEALKRVPVMVIRGDRSDILSKKTVEEMQRRHPAVQAVTVRGQGHAPLLRDATTIEAVARFLFDIEQVSTASYQAYA